MRKLIALALFAVVVLASCKEDDTAVDPTPKTTAEKVQHKWNLTSIFDINYVGSTTTIESIDTIDIGVGGYLDFRSDNKVYMNIDGDLDTSDYQIINDNAISFDGDAFKITTLTDTEFKLTYEERTDTPYYDNVVTMNR